jgi:signal transduction histidine kinase
MITEKKIKIEKLSAEEKTLHERITHLRNNRPKTQTNLIDKNSTKADVIKPIGENKAKFKNIFPFALSAAITGMLLIGALETFLIIFIPIESLVTFALITVGAVSLLAGIGSYYMKNKLEEIRSIAITELVRNEQAEISIAETREEFKDRIEKRTSQIWDTNKYLKKEIIRRRDVENNIKKYNEQLLDNRKILENKNLELEKLNVELKNSEQGLKELNNSKDKFFSILAHDLKNPFASIIGLSEFLNDEMDSLTKDETKKIVRSITHSSKRVHKLLENLLKWSLLQTGRIKFYPVAFNLSNLISETAELFVQTAEAKKITIIAEFNHSTLVFADVNMIETAIRNLISNAIKFTDTNGRILIRTVQQNKFVRVDIIDNGIGISEQDIDKIFRIEEHTTILGTGNEKGTGIGLVLSKEFVERNGGKIWFSSELGEGTQFNITIPAVAESEKTIFDNYNLTDTNL